MEEVEVGCTCQEGDNDPCPYCQEMTVWAHFHLYGPEEDDFETYNRLEESEALEDELDLIAHLRNRPGRLPG